MTLPVKPFTPIDVQDLHRWARSATIGDTLEYYRGALAEDVQLAGRSAFGVTLYGLRAAAAGHAADGLVCLVQRRIPGTGTFSYMMQRCRRRSPK